MPSDPFAMLEHDHREVERLLTNLSGSEPGPERQQMVTQLTEALRVHMTFEEQGVYPLIVDAMDRETEEEAEIEHRLAREGLSKLAELVDAPGFGAAVEMVTGGIRHHVKEEEGEIFPKLRRAVDETQQKRLASRLLDAKRAAGLPPMDYTLATKKELLEAAADAGIGGRSSMTKDDLVEALQHTH